MTTPTKRRGPIHVLAFMHEDSCERSCRTLRLRVNFEDMLGETSDLERSLGALHMALNQGQTGFAVGSEKTAKAFRSHGESAAWIEDAAGHSQFRKQWAARVAEARASPITMALDVAIGREQQQRTPGQAKRRERKTTPARRPRNAENMRPSSTPRSHRQTMSSRRKRNSQLFDVNDFVPFEACMKTPTGKWPRSTAQHVPLSSTAELDRVTRMGGGGASAQAAERRYQAQRLKRLEAQVKEAHDQLREMRLSGGVALPAPKEHTLEEIETALRRATKRLVIDGDESASADCEKWSDLLSKHPEYVARLATERQHWEDMERHANLQARWRMRRCIPSSNSVLEGAGLPDPLIRRILTIKVLRLVRLSPTIIAKTHVVDLRAYDVSSLDMIELRAVYASLPDAFQNDPQGLKRAWKDSIQAKLRDALQNKKSRLDRHPAYADLPSDADLTLEPPYDPEDDDDDSINLVKSGLDNEAKTRRNQELEVIATTRKSAAPHCFGEPVARRRTLKQADRIRPDDPRTAMLAAIVKRNPRPTDTKPPFLAQLIALKRNDDSA